MHIYLYESSLFSSNFNIVSGSYIIFPKNFKKFYTMKAFKICGLPQDFEYQLIKDSLNGSLIYKIRIISLKIHFIIS